MIAPHTAIKRRDASLDLFKTILICLMVWAHAVQLLDNINASSAELFLSRLANFVCFSGFIFAFGMGFAHSTSGIPAKTNHLLEKWSSPLLLYCAYLLCGASYLVLVDNRPLLWSWGQLMLSMSRLYAYSEFLATFTLLAILAGPLRSPFARAASSLGFLILSFLAALLLSFFPTPYTGFPLLPVLIGYKGGPTFPLVHYLPWFLLGFWYVRQKMKPSFAVGIACLMASLPCAFFLYVTGELPKRDPPQALWLMGAALPLYLLLLASSWMAKRKIMPVVASVIGQHALRFYVGSSLMFFGLNAWLKQHNYSFAVNTLIALAVMSFLYAVINLWDRLKKQRHVNAPA